ncbi:MAG: hypothetical protein JO322_03910 [Candidatus Eremiobacteraeota bacterium]|nr:hypothetical protein [Candidatus Eremiobacteraeota bacterium]
MSAIALEQRHALVDRIVDIVTVVLISLAAFGTAWCSYQSARWSALQALNYSKANAARVLASTYAERANSRRIIDIMVFAEYERASDQHEPFASFVRQRFDAPLEYAVTAWDATNPLHNKKAPRTPFAMSAYHLPEEDAEHEAAVRADALVEDAVSANETSDHYVFLTVLFAAASFLGGIAIKLRRPMNLAAASVGVAVFFVSLAIMLTYPIR